MGNLKFPFFIKPNKTIFLFIQSKKPQKSNVHRVKLEKDFVKDLLQRNSKSHNLSSQIGKTTCYFLIQRRKTLKSDVLSSQIEEGTH